jgi:hypothetical protein
MKTNGSIVAWGRNAEQQCDMYGIPLNPDPVNTIDPLILSE